LNVSSAVFSPGMIDRSSLPTSASEAAAATAPKPSKPPFATPFKPSVPENFSSSRLASLPKLFSFAPTAASPVAVVSFTPNST
jgi:hypothetical protein